MHFPYPFSVLANGTGGWNCTHSIADCCAWEGIQCDNVTDFRVVPPSLVASHFWWSLGFQSCFSLSHLSRL
ncbi:hypothetical protein RJT34_12858 [Clitoria ternatea]|uniref:Leucine-rich repeat-containing N-terminal plant-type domain-containing protein n=1 Tax=Clitoria ternatea TaxID=43366 RepID=A0AAN9JPU2_CLITE